MSPCLDGTLLIITVSMQLNQAPGNRSIEGGKSHKHCEARLAKTSVLKLNALSSCAKVRF